jgi:hypothetical protein
VKLLLSGVFGLVLLTGMSGPGPLKDSMGTIFTFRDEMAKMRGEIADLRYGRGAGAPGWVTQYADALCASDSGFVVAHTDPALGMTVPDIQAQFQRMHDSGLDCSGVRYLGSVGSDQFVFVLHHGPKDVWYVLTVAPDGRTIAKVE